MTNEEKAQEISEKYKNYKVECSALDCYLSALEMAKYKDRQPQIIELFGRRLKVVWDVDGGGCRRCSLSSVCQAVRGNFKNSLMCKSAEGYLNRHFEEVDEDGNEIK